MDFAEGLVIWMRQPLNALLVCVIFLAFLWIVLKTNRLRRRALSFRILDSCRTHRWHYCEYLDKPTYCNSCLQLCLSGSSCGSCGVCVCSLRECLGQANRAQQCKPLTVPPREQTPHFWVKGNLPLSSLCYKCMSPCGNVPKLCDFRCVWCDKTAHDSCISSATCSNEKDDTCSLGPFRSLVLPPNCVQVALEGWRGQRRLVIKKITPPAVNEWKPLVVMANLQSGGKDGEKVLSTFRKLLNPVQVCCVPGHGCVYVWVCVCGVCVYNVWVCVCGVCVMCVGCMYDVCGVGAWSGWSVWVGGHVECVGCMFCVCVCVCACVCVVGGHVHVWWW